MRRLIYALAIWMAWLSAGFAFDDPKALVAAIYEPYQSGTEQVDLERFYSAPLKALFRHAEERDSVGLVDIAEPAEAPAAFNPFVSGDNFLLYDLTISEPQVMGDRALVTVRFHNFDHPSLLSLSLLREADGWKVDDIASMGADEHWLLSWLLAFDPLRN